MIKVLIVDDNSVNRLVLSSNIKRLGIKLIEFAVDGEEGLKHFHSFKPTHIFLDIEMPKMNGINCLKAIRSFDKEKQTKIIMVTSSSDKDIVVECIKNGATGYLIKPIVFDNLKEYF